MTFPSNGRLRLLHLGLGSFHRAHQAVYMHRLLQAGDARWQLAGANLRPDMADTLAALQRQGGAYTLETVSPQGARRLERITAITEVVPFEPTLARVLALGPIRPRASSRSRSPKPAMRSTTRAGSTSATRTSPTIWRAGRRARSTARSPPSCGGVAPWTPVR